jgi:hypothetical protein
MLINTMLVIRNLIQLLNNYPELDFYKKQVRIINISALVNTLNIIHSKVRNKDKLIQN